MADTSPALSSVERAALALGRFVNERQQFKQWQITFLNALTRTWVRAAIASRVYADGIDWLLRAQPDRGILLAANHRSFFDMYIIMLALFEQRPAWIRGLYFPVRSNFFYEHPAGVALNYVVGAGVMYPPIFRDAAKADLNKDALDRVARVLATPGTVVGVHPEGTRGKGPDPYELLPAQPGVGQMVLQGKPIVVPVFINGLGNDIRHSVTDTFRADARRQHPIIICMGEPLDYSELTQKKPRAALYKRCSDKMMAAIRELGERERSIREACARGDIRDDDPCWVKGRGLF